FSPRLVVLRARRHRPLLPRRHGCFLPFFFPLPRPPPRAPLFPYTTLFRSCGADWPAYVLASALSGQWPHLTLVECVFNHHFTAGDRKSTRLNSSHVKISYAVFCLKKNTT